MSESRDSNDPRDAMRAMRKETEAEFERTEAEQTGGQEHASPADRAGTGAERRAEEAIGEEIDRVTAEQSDAGVLRVPRGDPTTAGGSAAGGPPATGPGEPGAGHDQS